MLECMQEPEMNVLEASGRRWRLWDGEDKLTPADYEVQGTR